MLIGCMEDLAANGNYKKSGLFCWEVFSTQYSETNLPFVRSILRPLFGRNGVIALRSMELIGILVILTPKLHTETYLPALLTVLAVKLLLFYRCGYGADGSDQMENMVLIGLIATTLLAKSQTPTLGLWFITAESTLAYFVSGVSKLFSQEWRSGSAAFQVFNTYTYGVGPVAALLRQSSAIGGLICWGTIIYECVFPVCLVSPASITWTILGFGIFFHVANAFIMGLNKFFWAFVSTYPAILYCQGHIYSHLNTR